jgi:hypothetical protein
MRSTSKENKLIQRANAIAEVAGVLFPSTDMPVRVSQTFTSASFFFKRNTSKQEKLLNALQFILSVVGIALQVACMFAPSIGLELALNGIDLMYRCTLIGALGHSEINRSQKINDS